MLFLHECRESDLSKVDTGSFHVDGKKWQQYYKKAGKSGK